MKLAYMIVIIKRLLIAIVFISIVVWAYYYYSEKIFYINDIKYSENALEPKNITYYTASGGNEIRLIKHEDYRELDISGKIFKIEETKVDVLEKTFIVTYPSGKTYTVRNYNSNDLLLAFDENDEMYISTVAYSNNGPIFTSNEQHYHPSSLVSAAYEEYHERQGNLIIFILSLILFVLSWLLFSNKSLQMFIFHLSYGLDVVDPEPSDFYFATTKLGALVA
ncbi:MAG: hypothetical protein NAG76_14405 [Candidatus Pristimantibacillus lignocellulolyticus]|uniref:Uncharacterized protein n=1 Tax=Candidatus Pristimantibacillus lignocellulolyticus TaxID=2994561 RepID=A0A9J6ZAR0_9BACL|nr:MAG: hypothetical protein NAG76_14405 [Candidatus Pristimantibacillus lignocellulolyticus]